MNKLSHSQLHDRIAAVERRLTRRRAQLFDNARESGSAAKRTAIQALPFVAALGAGLVALYFTRRHQAKRPVSAWFRPPAADPPRRAVRWASIAGILGSVVRIGTSPHVRALWYGYQRARQRRGR